MVALRGELSDTRVLAGQTADTRPLNLDGGRDQPLPRMPEDAATWQEVARLRAQLEEDHAAPEPAAPPAPDLPLHAFDATGSRRRIGEILVEADVITSEQLAEALGEQERSPHRRLGSIFVEKGYTGETAIAQVLASQLKTQFVRLSQEVIDPDMMRLLNPRVARRHECVPLRATDDRLILAMANPFDLIAIDDAELASGRRVDPVVATPTDIHHTLDRLL
jgi:hypothetical protein